MKYDKSKMKLNLLKNIHSRDLIKDKFNKISKPIVISSMVVGGYITSELENLIEQVRYPIKLEYSIISECAKGYNNGYLSSRSKESIDICICALENTMNDVEPENISNEFSSEFRRNLRKCK